MVDKLTKSSEVIINMCLLAEVEVDTAIQQLYDQVVARRAAGGRLWQRRYYPDRGDLIAMISCQDGKYVTKTFEVVQ